MNIARFRHLADAYGADIGRWPAAERAAATDLVARSDEAQAALAGARVIDAWLDLAEPTVTDAQVERVLATINDRIDRDRAAPVRSDIPAGRSAAGRSAADLASARRSFWTRPSLPAAFFLVGMAMMGVLAGADAHLQQPGTAQQAGIASLVSPEPYILAWNQ